MTREEAMSYIIPAIERTWNDKICKQIKEVLNEQPCEDAISRKDAIDTYKNLRLPIYPLEELPSVTPKHCEDAISRQEVLDLIADYDLSMGQVVRGIHKLPSVSTEETGHWIRKTKVDAYDLCGVKTWGIKCQCDRCTFTTTVVEDFGYYKYCPNCGARMVEPQAESEE
jgi:hypothetical protein